MLRSRESGTRAPNEGREAKAEVVAEAVGEAAEIETA